MNDAAVSSTDLTWRRKVQDATSMEELTRIGIEMAYELDLRQQAMQVADEEFGYPARKASSEVETCPCNFCRYARVRIKLDETIEESDDEPEFIAGNDLDESDPFGNRW